MTEDRSRSVTQNAAELSCKSIAPMSQHGECRRLSTQVTFRVPLGGSLPPSHLRSLVFTRFLGGCSVCTPVIPRPTHQRALLPSHVYLAVSFLILVCT